MNDCERCHKPTPHRFCGSCWRALSVLDRQRKTRERINKIWKDRKEERDYER